MTALETRRRGSAMVARNSGARKRPQPKKLAASGAGGYLAAAFAAWISLIIDWTAGDSVRNLARQAGPGPRM
jgi:hypothetical protein